MKDKRKMLIEVLNGGEKISLIDGTLWLIDPSDMPTVCTWIPTASILIKRDNSRCMFSYELVNENIGIPVHAHKL